LITNYVVGFAFDQYDAVTLINKQKPAWQKDKWNGVGGKIEEGEDAAAAMAREFFEETGMRTSPPMWRHVGRLIERDCVVQIFTMRVPVLRVHTTTKEAVKVFIPGEQAALGGDNYPCIPNIPVFLEMSRLGPDPRGHIPFFTLDYTHAVR
jgi:8-oxo-dGTP pyrophosphatase MutT (NUDIX family)